MSWGTELWDRYEVLHRHTNGGIQFLESSVASFVKERGKIENEYAHKLRKLIEKYTPKEPSSGKNTHRPNEEYSYITGYKEMLKEVGYVAGQHELLGDHCCNESYKKMHEEIKKLKEKRKKNCKDFQRIESELKKAYKSFESSKDKFRKAFEEQEKSTEAYRNADSDENVPRNEMDKLKQIMNTRSQVCDTHKLQYASSLLETNDFQREYYSKLLPSVLDQLQSLEKDRISVLVEAVNACVLKEKEVFPIVGKCHDSILEAMKNINPQDDTEIVIEKFKSGDIPPGDFKMDDMSGPYEMLHKEPMEKATNLNLYPRKRELERLVDENERELAISHKTLNSIKIMIDSYEKNPTFGSKKDKDKFQVEFLKLQTQIKTLQKENVSLTSELSRVEDRLESLKNRSPMSSGSPMLLQRDHRGSQSSGSLKSSNLSIGSNSVNTTITANMNTSPDHSVPEEEFESWEEGGGSSPPPPPPPPVILDGSQSKKGLIYGCAIYAYEGDNGTDNIIPMAEGEKFQIIEEDFDASGWTRVKRISNSFYNDSGEGYVPTLFLKMFYPSTEESRI